MRCVLSVSPAAAVFGPRIFLAALLGVAASGEARAAEETVGPVIELPKFIVTDSRELPPPEAWRHAEMPGFEILSNASDKATQRLLKDFALFKQALGYAWPIPDRSSGPTLLILCGRGGKFDAFVPDGKAAVDSALASVFLHDREQSAIVIDFETTTLNIAGGDTTNDAATGTDSTQISVDHNKQLYREYVRYLLSKSEPRSPAWFEEGMAQIIMAMKFDRTQIVIGQLEDPNTISAQAGAIQAINAGATADDADAAQLAGAPAEDRDFNAALQRKALVPMDKFFAVAHDAPEALNPLGNNRWAKQAYAFLHLCLYGRGGRYQKPFAQFLQRLGKEPVSEALFKECFGMDYKKMLFELRGYIDFTDYKIFGLNAKKGESLPVPPPLVLREATQAEVGRIKGEALMMAGHREKARAALIAPYTRGESDPPLLAALGLFDHAVGEDERARKFLDAAVAKNVVRPAAYLEQARFRYNDAVAKPGAADGKFSPAQVTAVLAPLLVARTQPSPSAGIFELAADTWFRSAAIPTREDLLLLTEGVQRFPTRLRMIYQTAALCAQAGLNAAAHSLVDHGLKYAPDATARARFQELKAALPPDTAPKPEPAAPKSPAPKSK